MSQVLHMPQQNEHQSCVIEVKFGHSVVLTLLEKSAIEREWRATDGFLRSRHFFLAPRPAVGRYQKALEAMVREILKLSQMNGF